MSGRRKIMNERGRKLQSWVPFVVTEQPFVDPSAPEEARAFYRRVCSVCDAGAFDWQDRRLLARGVAVVLVAGEYDLYFDPRAWRQVSPSRNKLYQSRTPAAEGLAILPYSAMSGSPKDMTSVFRCARQLLKPKDSSLGWFEELHWLDYGS